MKNVFIIALSGFEMHATVLCPIINVLNAQQALIQTLREATIKSQSLSGYR